VFLLICALVGVLAQFVDATLGMAFGITSSTFLLLAGTSPLAASASVHTAEIGTTLTAGFAHWRAGNVDRRILLHLAVPGALGAFLGASVLVRVSLSASRPLVSIVLLVLGLVLLWRFGFRRRTLQTSTRTVSGRLLAPLGLVAGFVDAAGGGGWGPIATPTLLALTDHEPRKVVGTVSAAEFLVTLSAVAGFLSGASFMGANWQVVVGLLLGGALVAPFAARLVSRMEPRRFGTLVAALVLLTNGDQLLRLAGAAPLYRLVWLAVVAVVVAVALRRRTVTEMSIVSSEHAPLVS